MSATISAELALEELMGTKCHGCDGDKAPRMSHCRACYFRLGQPLRRTLYRSIGAGYEAAYTESLEILRLRNGLPARTFP